MCNTSNCSTPGYTEHYCIGCVHTTSSTLESRKEREIWKAINEDYMTEESAEEAGDTFRQHCLTWISESVCVIAVLY